MAFGIVVMTEKSRYKTVRALGSAVRRRGIESLHIDLVEYTDPSRKSARFVGLRIWERDYASGAYVPTNKGVNLNLNELEVVKQALEVACKEAASGQAPSGGDGHG